MRRTAERPRANAQSIRRIRAAVLRLLDENGPDHVTITDAVKEAGVTRPTFYAAFGNLPTAFADAARSRLDEAFDGMTVTSDVPESERSDAMATAFQGILNRLEPHAEFYSQVLRGPGGARVHEQIVDFVAGRLRDHSPLSSALADGPLPMSVTSSALAAGVTWTIIMWLDDDDRISTGELAALLRDLIVGAVTGGLSGSR